MILICVLENASSLFNSPYILLQYVYTFLYYNLATIIIYLNVVGYLYKIKILLSALYTIWWNLFALINFMWLQNGKWAWIKVQPRRISNSLDIVFFLKCSLIAANFLCALRRKGKYCPSYQKTFGTQEPVKHMQMAAECLCTSIFINSLLSRHSCTHRTHTYYLISKPSSHTIMTPSVYTPAHNQFCDTLWHLLPGARVPLAATDDAVDSERIVNFL